MNQAQLEAAYKLAANPVAQMAHQFLNNLPTSEPIDFDFWIEQHIKGGGNNTDPDVIYYECVESMSNEVMIVLQDSLRKL
jgi:hypothetical protein